MKKEVPQEEKKKGFFAKLMEKLDKKLEAQSKKDGCGCGPKKPGGDSCCG
jgi:hypothetical protein